MNIEESIEPTLDIELTIIRPFTIFPIIDMAFIPSVVVKPESKLIFVRIVLLISFAPSDER